MSVNIKTVTAANNPAFQAQFDMSTEEGNKDFHAFIAQATKDHLQFSTDNTKALDTTSTSTR
jgi:hypothetical protein